MGNDGRMLTRIWQEAMVGLLVIVAVLTVGYYTVLQKIDSFSDFDYHFKIVFDNVEGLIKGSKIRVLGVDIGRVAELEVVEKDVVVKAQISQLITLYENYVIEIRNESALGGKYISIYPGNEEAPLLTEDIRDKVFQGASLRDPFTSLSQIIDENKANVYQIISNVNSISHKINSGQGTLGKLINDDQAYREVNGLLGKTENLMGEVREGIEDAREQTPVTSFMRTILTVF